MSDNKLFKENGMLSAYGEETFARFLDGEILTLLNAAEDESELRIISSLIMQRVGNLTADRITVKKKAADIFAKMSDQQFEEYLQEKYGDDWRLRSLTQAEFDRVRPLSQEKIRKLLEEGAKQVTKFPSNGVRFPRKDKRFLPWKK